MSAKVIVGIDPGVNGAIAVLDEDGQLIRIADMPTLDDGAKGRRTLNAPLLASLIYETRAEQAYCELVGPRPTDGSAAGFGFGRCRGVIEGVCAAAGVPVTMIAPVKWKRAAGVPAGKEHKDAARSIAIARWPSQASLFARKLDVDRAEACLIGLVGIGKGKQ